MSNATNTTTEANSDKEQSLVEHLIELRTRLLKSLAAVFIVFLSLVFFSNDIYTFFALPIQGLLPVWVQPN